MENIIAVGAIAVICAATVTFFARADETARKSAYIERAAAEAVSLIENFKAGEELPSVVFYDESWIECDESGAAFKARSETRGARNLGAAAAESFSRYYGEEPNIKYVRANRYYEFSVTIETASGETLVKYDAVKYERGAPVTTQGGS